MKFKLDENLGSLGKSLLQAEGHDVMTVAEQQMSGADDEHLYRHCRDEGRVLVTLDHDFGQTIRFSLDDSPGVVILECKGRVSPPMVVARVMDLVALLRTQTINHELWIVEPGRIRIHERR